MMEISRNTFQRGIESDIAFTKVLRDVSHFTVWKLMASTKQ